eukprot:9494179-Pyramimonas_sp.AAC.1
MSYFHPWTLRQSEADNHAAFAGALRRGSKTWAGAMVSRLDGEAQSEEAARHAGNFLSVHRVRPRDAEQEGARSDED